MERYKYRGRKLTAIIARPLIYELFKGIEGVARAEITKAVDKEHRRRGGIESKHPSVAVKGALDQTAHVGNCRGRGSWVLAHQRRIHAGGCATADLKIKTRHKYQTVPTKTEKVHQALTIWKTGRALCRMQPFG